MAETTHKDRPTLERKIHFYRADAGKDGSGFPVPFDPFPAIKKINSLPFSERQGRYFATIDGNALCTWMHDQIDRPKIRFGQIRRAGLPHFVDGLLQQNRSPIYGTLASIFGTISWLHHNQQIDCCRLVQPESVACRKGKSTLLNYLAVFALATTSTGLATVLALLAPIFDRDTKPIPLLMFALVFAATLSLFRVLRAVWFLENVIETISKPKQ